MKYKIHIDSLPLGDEQATECARELVCMRVVNNLVVVLNAEDGHGQVIPIVCDFERVQQLYAWLGEWLGSERNR